MKRLQNGLGSLKGALVAMVCAFGLSPSAQAADTVILKYQSIQATVSVDEVEDFAADHQDISEPLQRFLEQTPLSPELMATLLDASIPDTGIPLGNTDIQFLLYQLNKLVGDPLTREDLRPLALALQSAYLDQDMSMLEIARRYPEDEVRLDFGQLEKVHRDVTLFVQRITPLLNFFDELLPDMVCECEEENDELTAMGQKFCRTVPDNPIQTTLASKSYPSDDAHLAAVIDDQNKTIGSFHAYDMRSPDFPRPNESTNTTLVAEWENSTDDTIQITPGATSTSTYVPYRISEDVVFALGPVRLSFSIADLTTFVETGDVPNGWRTPLSVANVEPEDLRSILTSEVEMDLREIDKDFNNLLGEYALFQLGQLIHTPSRTANIQALRGALILSVADDGKVSLLEFLQNYPAPQVIVESVDVLRLSRNLRGSGAVPTLTGGLEDVLVQIQEAIALEICECNGDER
ncbi:MAG: alpha/beta hydrolase [Cyanobacteria bacterium P01_F01_bin.150]